MQKKTFGILTALVLTVAMVAALALPAMGKSSDKVITVIGDSIAAGYGLPEYEKRAGSAHLKDDGDPITSAYPYLVAYQLNGSDCAASFNMHAHCAWRTTEFLRVIGSEHYDASQNVSGWEDNFLNGLGFAKVNAAQEKTYLTESLKAADIILVNYGTNDSYTYGLMKTIRDNNDTFNFASCSDISDLETAFNNMLSNAVKLGKAATLLAQFASNVEEGYKNFRTNFPYVMEEIKKLNSKAQIVVVGIDNPVKFSVELFDSVELDPYLLGDVLVSRQNSTMKSVAEEYGATFVDVTGTDYYDFDVITWDDEDELAFSALKMLHPTEDGHKQMAAAILSALNYEDTSSTPQNLTAGYTSVVRRIRLSWDDVDGAVSYRIYRSSSENGTYKQIGTSRSAHYVDWLTVKGRTYYYKVCAVMNNSGSALSPQSEAVSQVSK